MFALQHVKKSPRGTVMLRHHHHHKDLPSNLQSSIAANLFEPLNVSKEIRNMKEKLEQSR